MRNELKRTFLKIGPERFEEMVTWAIDNISGFVPSVGDIRKGVPPAKASTDPTHDLIQRAKEQWMREKDSPEYQSAMTELRDIAKKHGIKITGEWEKSRPRRDD